MESLLKRNYGILDIDKIKLLAEEWNQEYCIPPLNETEFEKQWKCATKWTGEKINENPNVDVDNNNENNTQEKEIYPELENNIFYQINEKPPKYVIAYKQKNKL